jgi:hypothetical protein
MNNFNKIIDEFDSNESGRDHEGHQSEGNDKEGNADTEYERRRGLRRSKVDQL